MSKAFLRESDDGSAFDPILPLAERENTKNYLTPDGFLRLQAELNYLRTDSRPPLVARIDEPDAKRELQRLDHRIRRLQHSLQTATVVEPPSGHSNTVQFGATVTVRDAERTSSRYRIVGTDEIDSERGWISDRSPLARAVLHAKVGQRITLETPRGPAELEILAVSYELETTENC